MVNGGTNAPFGKQSYWSPWFCSTQELKPSIMDSRLVQHFVCLQFISIVAIGWFSFSPKEIKEAKNSEEGMMLLGCNEQIIVLKNITL